MIWGIPVQFLAAKTPLLDESQARALAVPYEDVMTRAFSPEDLVVVAVQAGRAKDRQRVQTFLDASVDRARLDDILNGHGWME